MKTKSFRILILTALVAGSLFFLLERSFLPGTSSKLPPQTSFSLLGTIIRLIKSDYIEEANPAKTMEGAFKGMVHSLDMLSSYLEKESVIKYIQQQKTAFNDVGIILYKNYGIFPLVLGIVENSPAEKGGVKIGDYISALDDQSTLMWSLAETSLYLKDKDKKPVKLRLIRENVTQETTLERANQYTSASSYSSHKETAGILKLHHFFPSSTDEAKQHLLPQMKQQKKPLILDLRNCYEGDYKEARSFINLFFKAENIGYFKKKGEAREPLSCSDAAELEKLPLVIWINQGTVGPAELVAAVLKFFKRAKVVGIQTPGLVARQVLFPLDNGDALLLTTSTFRYASDEELWDHGVAADVKIEPDHQTSKAYLEKTLSLISHL